MKGVHCFFTLDRMAMASPRDIHRIVMNRVGSFLTLQSMNTDAPLYVDIAEGKSSGTRIFRITGPITLRNLFGLQGELRKGGVPKVSVLDLSAVPYMDSAGMGAMINYYTHCGNKGGRLIVAGVSNRVLELFKLTRVDTIIPMVASVDDAQLDS